MSVKRDLALLLGALLTAFLPAASVQAQDLPDGAGKELVMKVCAACHELTRITSKKWTKEQWNDTVDKMAARGAKASDEEFESIVSYLTKYFGPDQGGEKN
jgi:mono/diheme cytochrome c family protein